MPIKAQQNESGLSQHEQGSLTSMSDRLLDTPYIYLQQLLQNLTTPNFAGMQANGKNAVSIHPSMIDHRCETHIFG